MIDRERFEKLSQPIVEIYNEIQTDLLVNIAKRLGQNKNLLESDLTEWERRQLEMLNNMTEENIRLISRRAGVAQEEIDRALRQIGFEGIQQNEAILESAVAEGANLTQPPPFGEDTAILDILHSYQGQARDVLNLINSTLLDQSEQAYRDIINRTVADVLLGSKSHEQALRDTVRQWSDKGIPALIDRAGREWSTEGYVRMVTRTMSVRVTNDMQETRFDEWGVDLVEVSSHMGARPKCAPYQGRIFSRNGRTTRYPNLYQDTSYGEPDGLFGINCGHQQYPYIPGFSTQRYRPYDAERNEKAYENSQIQRRIERSIRQTKTEKRMMEALGDTEGVKRANAKLRSRQSKMREFIDKTGRKRRREREQIY